MTRRPRARACRSSGWRFAVAILVVGPFSRRRDRYAHRRAVPPRRSARTSTVEFGSRVPAGASTTSRTCPACCASSRSRAVAGAAARRHSRTRYGAHRAASRARAAPLDRRGRRARAASPRRRRCSARALADMLEWPRRLASRSRRSRASRAGARRHGRDHGRRDLGVGALHGARRAAPLARRGAARSRAPSWRVDATTSSAARRAAQARADGRAVAMPRTRAASSSRRRSAQNWAPCRRC